MTISIVTPFAGNTADLLPDYANATRGAQVVIVDNGTPEETQRHLAGVTEVAGNKYIRNETNLGFAAANNQGYAEAEGDIVIFLNSDVAADPAWLQLVSSDVKDGALYGPSLQYQLVAGRHLPYLEGWCVAATRETWKRLRWSERDLQEIGGEGGQVLAQRFKSVGPWDSTAYPGPYWEDNDLCLRALQQDIALIQTQWPVQHKGGRTAGSIMRHAASFAANERTFTERVLAAESPRVDTPTYAAYLHHCVTPSDIQHHLPLLYSLARGNVLELGTRTGVSTAALLAGVEAHGGHVWSVDVDARSGGVAAGHPQWMFYHGSSMDKKTVDDLTLVDYIDADGDDNTGTRTFDLLLIDTDHTFEQASTELALWHSFVEPGGFVVMHDPETFPGVRRAATEFAAAKGWPITFVLPCNGMAVIERPKDG